MAGRFSQDCNLDARDCIWSGGQSRSNAGLTMPDVELRMHDIASVPLARMENNRHMPRFLQLLLLAQLVLGTMAANFALAAVDQAKCKKCKDQCVKTRQQCVQRACADNNGFFVRPTECKIKEIENQNKFREAVRACRNKSDNCQKKCDADHCDKPPKGTLPSPQGASAGLALR